MAIPQTFNQLTLDTGSSVATQFPRGYTVTTSNDGTNFGAAIATGSWDGPTHGDQLSDAGGPLRADHAVGCQSVAVQHAVGGRGAERHRAADVP